MSSTELFPKDKSIFQIIYLKPLADENRHKSNENPPVQAISSRL